MTKSKSWKFAIVIAIVLVVAIVGVMFIAKNNDKNAKAVMECSVNPNVQFVLNSSNKVVGVNVLNEDGEKIVANVNFEGKSAEEAAKLFVELSTEAGHINVDTTGTTVSVNIYAENTEDYKALKEKVTNKVNEYFSENGIIAGAITNISSDLKVALNNLNVSSKEYANKTTDEILSLINTTTDELKDTAVTLRTELMKAIELVKSGVSKTITDFNELITSLQDKLDKIEVDSLKTNIQKQLDNAKDGLNKANAELQKKIDAEVEKIREKSKEILEKAKTTMKEAQEAGKEILKNHKDAFNKDKELIESQIKDWQDSLKNKQSEI